MKNINDVQKEIGAIENLSDVDIAEMKPAAWRRTKKKLELLRLLVTYLETNPTESFVKAEIKRLEGVVSSKSKEFDPEPLVEKGVPKKEISKLRKAHESKYGLSKMRTQIRNMRVLLK